MASYFTNAYVDIQYMITAFSYLESPPVCWPVIASDMNQDPDSAITGRYIPDNTGEIQGVYNPKMQPTTLSSGLDTGRTFTALSGTWYDDYVDVTTNQNGLLMPDSTNSVSFDIQSTNVTPAIEPADIVMRRGIPGPGATRAQSDYTCYIETSYGSPNGTGWRIAMEWGQPIRLDYTSNNGSSWMNGVAIARLYGNLEHILQMNDGSIKFRVRPNESNGTYSVEIDNGIMLLGVSPDGQLPGTGNIRISGLNGSVSFNYFPLRAQPIQVTGKISLPQATQQGPNAFMTHNAIGYPSDAQDTATTITTSDNMNYDYVTTASLPDEGDGLGSVDPPILANVTMIVPAVWVDSLPGFTPTVAQQQLPNRIVMERQVFDDATRCAYSSATICVDNQYGQFNGAYGHQAITINASNGGAYLPRFIGIAGEGDNGIDISTIQTWGRMELPCMGREAAMMHAPATRRLYDGWCLFSAVLMECELGNVNPRFLQNIPLYIPPGATASAPYGEAGNDCPYPILAKGSGLNARYNFGPEVPPWTVLQLLAQENGYIDPTSGVSIPYYMGFQLDNQFHFEPYDPSQLTPVISYSDIDPTGVGQFDGELHVFNSCAAMRTDINFQGIDPFTYELLAGSVTQPDIVKAAVGYYYPWFERNARYSDQYLQQMMQVAAIIAARPQQVLKFRVPFQPYVNAGDVCFVESARSLGGSGKFVIIEIQSKYGMGATYGNSGIRESYSNVTCRSIAEYPRSSFLG